MTFCLPFFLLLPIIEGVCAALVIRLEEETTTLRRSFVLGPCGLVGSMLIYSPYIIDSKHQVHSHFMITAGDGDQVYGGMMPEACKNTFVSEQSESRLQM